MSFVFGVKGTVLDVTAVPKRNIKFCLNIRNVLNVLNIFASDIKPPSDENQMKITKS